MKINLVNPSEKTISFIGAPYEPEVDDRKQSHQHSRCYYKKCTIGSLKIAAGDSVMISNTDCVEPDSPTECDIAEIIYIYERIGDERKDPYRAIVKWYSRPRNIPHRFFDDDNISIDFDREIIEEHRPYDPDISLETIFNKCIILKDSHEKCIAEILYTAKMSKYPLFVCRYSFIDLFQKRRFKLIPIEEVKQIEKDRQLKENHVPYNLRKDSKEDFVSPIKIVNNTVIRLSSRRKQNGNIEEENANYLQNISESTMNLNKARRMILKEDEIIDTVLSDCAMENDPLSLDYSIVENETATDLRIKLRISEKQKSLLESNIAKRIDENNIFETPTKRSRKSILKLPGSTKENTPKKSVQLSKTVKETYYDPTDTKSDETCANMISSTPRRRKIVNTPEKRLSSARKRINTSSLTPTIASRNTPKSDKSNYEVVREQLHVSTVPEDLPCRENEYRNIYSFLRGKIEDGCSGCMYISGVPGTGKTATTTEVIRRLQCESDEYLIPEFNYVGINGMRLTEPRQAYVQIYKQLTGKNVSWEQAQSLLEKKFTTSGSKRKLTVLLVDELDILCNRKQDVIYNILDWPTKSSAMLVVITIANTMDLPERVLKGKITSRLGLTRLTFQPYTFKQLQEIVTQRLKGFDLFDKDAVQLVARKVAAVSGDARRALDICRRSVEISQEQHRENPNGTNLIGISHVQKAIEEMLSNPKVQAIKSCSKLEKIFLQSICAEITRTGVEETSFLSVYSQMETICAYLGVLLPTAGNVLKICSRLGTQKYLICEQTSVDLYRKILLNVNQDDIHYALRTNPVDFE